MREGVREREEERDGGTNGKKGGRERMGKGLMERGDEPESRDP